MMDCKTSENASTAQRKYSDAHLIVEFIQNCNNGGGAGAALGGEIESPPVPKWQDTYKRLRRASSMIGASAVAIDNKIEQALDLVKNHLMFAVREEVEVLREEIKKLVDKNSVLEYENAILRAAAPPDIVAKLGQRPEKLELRQ